MQKQAVHFTIRNQVPYNTSCYKKRGCSVCTATTLLQYCAHCIVQVIYLVLPGLQAIGCVLDFAKLKLDLGFGFCPLVENSFWTCPYISPQTILKLNQRVRGHFMILIESGVHLITCTPYLAKPLGRNFLSLYSQSLWNQWTPSSHSAGLFYATMYLPMTYMQLIYFFYKPHTTHSSSIHSDEG